MADHHTFSAATGFMEPTDFPSPAASSSTAAANDCPSPSVAILTDGELFDSKDEFLERLNKYADATGMALSFKQNDHSTVIARCRHWPPANAAVKKRVVYEPGHPKAAWKERQRKSAGYDCQW